MFSTNLLILVILIQAKILTASEKLVLPLCNEIKPEDTLCSLVEDYDYFSPPEYPTEVYSNLDVKAIQDIDESRHTVTFLVEFYIYWTDQRLSYTNSTAPSKSPIKKIDHFKNSLWVPDIYFPKNYQAKKAEGLKGGHAQTLFYNLYNGTFHIGLSDELMVTFECKMNFANFPFDQQNCEWTYRSKDLLSTEVILKTPNLYATQSQSYTQYLSTGNAIKLNNHGGLQFDASIQVKDSILVPLLDGDDNMTFSYSGIEFSFVRSGNEINKLLISYYFPSGAFAILSLFSFFINPLVVPGRMGMLVTIFLVVTTTYNGVKAPPGRGFSYIELWYIGVQIPILFALLDYGIILAINKYVNKKTPPKTPKKKKSSSLEDTFKIADFVAFCCSLTFIALFNSVYLYLCLQA